MPKLPLRFGFVTPAGGVEAVEKPQNLDDDRKEAMRVIMRRDLTRFISDRFEKAYIEPQAL
jgi:hypothetical protein